jgi:zinc D-Ala-D-Ala carboxypeptidase
MKDLFKHPQSKLIIFVTLSSIFLAYLFYYQSNLLYETNSNLASTTSTLEKTQKNLGDQITNLTVEKDSFRSALEEEQRKNDLLTGEQRNSERKIDLLVKLTTIDPELLKKYSKIYFLNENYNPQSLVQIKQVYLINPSKSLEVLDKAAPFLENLLKDANAQNMSLRVVSAYRSFETQKDLKTGYRITYGAGTANQFSADQGYSEHQLGTTVDFGTPEVPGATMAFEKTPAFNWLQNNAHKYGFILSYPKNNSYYIYEPWHWRFVGRELASHLKNTNKNFYDLDQREIDSYLIKIFD